MEKEKLQRANEIQKELKALVTLKDELSDGGNYKVRLFVRNEYDDACQQNDNISDELENCVSVSKAIILASVDRRILELENEFKNL